MTAASPVLTDLEERLARAGALLSGHFQLSSGLHSDRYVQCARLLCLPDESQAVGVELARRFADAGADLVVGPALGGVILAHEVARALKTPCYFAERKDGVMQIRRGFVVEPGARVLLVEDVVTTGGSLLEVMALLDKAAATVVGVGALVHRGQELPFEARFEALLRVPLKAWKSAECPMCSGGEALVRPGSRPQA